MVVAQAEVARSDWGRLGTGEGSPLVLRVPQLAEARAALAAAEAQRERAQRDVERCSVRAPYAGRVRAKLADEGQFVGRGVALAQLYAVDRAEVRLPLADDELAHLDLPLAFRGAAEPAPGPPVLLRARFAGEEHAWEGRVVRTEGELDPESRMLIAVVEVQDPYGRGGEEARPPLAVGMFVRAEILGREVAQAIVLPRAALRDADQVLVVDADDRLGLRSVELLRTERDMLVLRGGLSEGERVVTSPLDVVIEGMRVSVEDATPGAAGER